MTKPRIGLFLIRAWVEPGSTSPLRVQVRRTSAVAQGFGRTLITADEEVVVAAVRAWLAEMLADPVIRHDGPGGPAGT